MTDSLLFGKAQLIESGSIAPESCDFLGAASLCRPLRKLDDGTLRSGLLALPRHWTSASPIRVKATVQFLVRKGGLEIGDASLGENAFVVLPAGGIMPVVTVTEDSELLVIHDAGQAYEAAPAGNDARIAGNVFDIEPIVPVINGRVLTGFERRVLWLDPETGGDTRLLRIPAGFSGAGPSWHPVNEEIFCLDGEICPSQDRTMKAGSFLWNPARSVHGYHEMTIPGCILLEWHDGLWDLIKYEEPAC